MSRSNPTITNPAKHFLKWSGSEGKLVYYDKAKQEDVEMKLPFEFLLLDQLATITGFCKPDKSSYWSNEVRSVAQYPFTVRTSKGIKQEGLYKELADVRAKGAKYAKSLYIAYIEDKEWCIGNIKASGAALTSWIEFSNTCAVGNGKIRVVGKKEEEGVAGPYYSPTFEWDHATEEEDQEAVKLDQVLQKYLKTYLDSAQFDYVSGNSTDASDEEDDLEEDLRKTEQKQIANAVRSKVDDLGGEPINLDDIPF